MRAGVMRVIEPRHRPRVLRSSIKGVWLAAAMLLAPVAGAAQQTVPDNSGVTHGVHAVGLTNCETHVAVAREHAEERGVGHLVEFVHGDFMMLPFPDAHFDAVLNHESFGYVWDKRAYFRGVYRVLKPGGRWQSLDGLLSGVAMSEAQQKAHAIMHRGWRMAPLEPWRNVSESLEEAGFVEICAEDLSSEAATSTKEMSRRWRMYMMLTGSTGERQRILQQWKEATVNYDRGLRAGIFTYHFMGAVRPNEPSAS